MPGQAVFNRQPVSFQDPGQKAHRPSHQPGGTVQQLGKPVFESGIVHLQR